jgi:putative transposase
VRKVLKAEWQRCKVHFYRNVLVHVPKRSQAEVSEAMKAVFVQRDEKSAKAKAADLVRQFQTRFAKAMEIFEAGIDDVLSYLHYPQSHHVRISSTNPLERLNLEIRRRTRVVGIFPNPAACLRLIGMLLVEKNDDRLTDDKAYLTFDDAPVEESDVEGCIYGCESIRKEALFECEGSPSRSQDLSLSRQNGCGVGPRHHSGP